MKEPHVCPWWLAYTFDNPFRKFLHRPDDLFGRYIKPGMTVLDIGCGMGYFSLGLARLVGATGKVIALDLQQKMLEITLKRAQKAGFTDQIIPQKCSAVGLGIDQKVDFALAFWMVHETPEQARFYREVFSLLQEGGRLFVAEPVMHVSQLSFAESIKDAEGAGFSCERRPSVRLSRAALFLKASDTARL